MVGVARRDWSVSVLLLLLLLLPALFFCFPPALQLGAGRRGHHRGLVGGRRARPGVVQRPASAGGGVLADVDEACHVHAVAAAGVVATARTARKLRRALE